MARKTMLDDLRAKRICDAIRMGHAPDDAARAGGIAQNTLHEWLARGRGTDPDRDDPEGIYAKFAAKYDEAELEASNLCVEVLQSALVGPDRKLAVSTAQWWLERRRPKEWGKPKDEPTEDLTKLPSDEECEEIVRKIKALAI